MSRISIYFFCAESGKHFQQGEIVNNVMSITLTPDFGSFF